MEHPNLTRSLALLHLFSLVYLTLVHFSECCEKIRKTSTFILVCYKRVNLHPEKRSKTVKLGTNRHIHTHL